MKKEENAKKAWLMGQTMYSMNNEEAVYGTSWLYLYPDEGDEEEIADCFGEDEDYEELYNLFVRIYKAYHSDGLFRPTSVVEEFVKELDKELGLPDIEIFR